MSLIRLAIRKKRDTPVLPPSSGLALPRGAVNGWGTAADFYDSVGINVHVENGEAAQLANQNSAPTVIARAADIGLRHIRDGTIPSWNHFLATGVGGRQLWVRLRTRNRALPAPSSTDKGHPIFLTTILDPWGPTIPAEVTRMADANKAGTMTFRPSNGTPWRINYGKDFTPTGIMQFHGGGHQHFDGNANVASQLPYVGNPILDSATAPNPATIVPQPWAFSDAECPWEIVGALGGPNEPFTRPAGVRAMVVGTTTGAEDTNSFSATYNEINKWMNDLWKAKNAQTGTGYGSTGTLSGNARIVTEGGLSTTRPDIDQIPLIGYVNMGSGAFVYNEDGNLGPIGASSQRDSSKGSPFEVDVGDYHPYHYAMDPSVERKEASNSAGGATGIGFTHPYDGYFNGKRNISNGSQNPTPLNTRAWDPARALPQVHTEWGLASRAQAQFDVTNLSGQWPSPQDVNAEYTVRQYLLAWYWGIRRTYAYQMNDNFDNAGDAEQNLGWYDFNGNKKPTANAIKNLLTLVGFSEPATDKRKLNLTVSGYPTGQTNDQHDQNGVVRKRYARRLDAVQIQQDDNNWLVALVPTATLWDIVPGNRNAGNTAYQTFGNPTAGRKAPSTETVTITLPAEITSAQVAWPTRNLTPNGASYTWTTPADGQTWDPVTITNNQITVDIAGNTKLVKLTKSAAPPATKPIVVPAVGSTPVTLRTGSTVGPRLHLKGINIWGLPDDITNNVTVGVDSFWKNQYDNRVAICNTIQGWGANCVRMRAQASDYNVAPSAATDSLTKTQILDRIENWFTAITDEQMYMVLCPWDGLDGPYASGFGLNANIDSVCSFYTDVWNRLKNHAQWALLMFETPNEPNNQGTGPGSLTMATWQTAIQRYITHFRETMDYFGVLVVDPPNWANSGGTTDANGNPAGYSDGTYGSLQSFDAGKPGMTLGHQLVFAKHDYSNNGGYPNNTFNINNWRNGMGGGRITHLIWENEFGNYNGGGPDPDTDDTWAAQMAAAARDEFSLKQWFVGAAPFLFGPWSDLNRITKNASDSGGPSNSDPKVPWGITVRDTYFGNVTPPAVGFTPGVVANGSTTFNAGAVTAASSLGALVSRVEFSINDDVSVAGAARTNADNIFTQYANAGIRILMLAGGPEFTNTVPTPTQCANVAGWAARYGPGGAFWTGVYGGTDRPITHIEFGNENAYSYRPSSAGGPPSAQFTAKAVHYGQAFKTTKDAIVAGGSGVGLLAEGAGDRYWLTDWLDGLFQVSNFSALVDGWTAHPYGPDGPNKMQGLVNMLATKGAPTSIPLEITEMGVATDNGRTLTAGNDYSNGRQLTYAQAATTLQNQVTTLRTAPYGSRIRHFMLYQAHDNQPVGGPSVDTEGYYGGLNSANGEKGAFSTAYRTILDL